MCTEGLREVGAATPPAVLRAGAQLAHLVQSLPDHAVSSWPWDLEDRLPGAGGHCPLAPWDMQGRGERVHAYVCVCDWVHAGAYMAQSVFGQCVGDLLTCSARVRRGPSWTVLLVPYFAQLRGTQTVFTHRGNEHCVKVTKGV